MSDHWNRNAAIDCMRVPYGKCTFDREYSDDFHAKGTWLSREGNQQNCDTYLSCTGSVWSTYWTCSWILFKLQKNFTKEILGKPRKQTLNF